jgi:hypothetical protein
MIYVLAALMATAGLIRGRSRGPVWALIGSSIVSYAGADIAAMSPVQVLGPVSTASLLFGFSYLSLTAGATLMMSPTEA